MGHRLENPFCEPTGDGIRMLVPRHALPETELFWPLPRALCAQERNRARAYSMAFTATIGLDTGKGIITREINSCGCTLE